MARRPRRRRPDRRLPAAPAARPRRPAAHRRRRVDRCGQVHARQQPGRARRSPPPACSGRPPRSPVLVCAAADVAAFSGDRVLPGLPRVTGGPRRTRARCSWSSATTCPPAWRCSTPRTSTPSSRPTATSPGSCSPRPTCGSSSRRRPATPTPSPGTCCGRRRSAAPRSPSCSTGCPPEAARRGGRRPGRDAPARRAGRRARLFVIEERPLRRRAGCPEDQVAPLRGLAARAGRRPGGPRRRRPADPDRRAGQPGAAGRAASRPRSRRRTAAAAALRAAAARRLRRAPARASTRASAAARCCAARCWPAGRSSSAPGEWMRGLQGRVGRLRDRVAGALTGRPTPARRPAGRAGEQRRAAAAGRGRPRRRAHGHRLAGAARRRGAAGRRGAASSSRCRRTSRRRPPRRCATGRAPCSTWSASEGADKRDPGPAALVGRQRRRARWSWSPSSRRPAD